MNTKLVKACARAAAVALAYDTGVSVVAALQGQPVARAWSMGILVIYVAIGFTSVRSLSVPDVLKVTAAAGITVGTLGSLIAFALRLHPEIMPLSPVVELVTALFFGVIGATIGGLMITRDPDPGAI